MSQALIDAVAKAIDNADPGESKYERIGIDACREYARAAIAAIEASGTHVVVPMRTTEEMIEESMGLSDAGISYRAYLRSIYATMLAARPKVTT